MTRKSSLCVADEEKLDSFQKAYAKLDRKAWIMLIL